MPKDFIAFDVETANGEPASICSIALVKVTDGLISDTLYTLVRPYPNYYFRRFTEEIHGLSCELTDCAPTFAALWPRLRDFIGNLPLVAHNVIFDRNCLRSAARYYGIDLPDYTYHCTLQAARRSIPRAMITSYSLPSVAHFLGIPFDNHHNAQADALACARIALCLI